MDLPASQKTVPRPQAMPMGSQGVFVGNMQGPMGPMMSRLGGWLKGGAWGSRPTDRYIYICMYIYILLLLLLLYIYIYAYHMSG
jgi:hypothetical protein